MNGGKKESVAREAAGTILWGVVAVSLALLLRATVAQSYHVPSPSMENTLLVGDHMIVEKLTPVFGTIERGDVLVFANPIDSHGFDLVKRVVGLPGEEVRVVDGTVYIDGARLDEPYAVYDPRLPARRYYGPARIPTKHYFMMGDNRDHSFDSRGWGFVAEDDVIGRAVIIHWSWKDGGWSVRWDRLGIRL
jgi:signal peptidase I